MDVIYLDSLFGLNLLIDYCLVLVSARVCGVVLRRWRYALAALIGALYAALMVLPGFGWLANGMMKLALGAAMALIAFGGEAHLVRCTVVFFAVSAAFGGAVYAASMLAGVSPGSGALVTVSGRVLALSFAACYAAVSLVFRRRARAADREVRTVTVTLAGPCATAATTCTTRCPACRRRWSSARLCCRCFRRCAHCRTTRCRRWRRSTRCRSAPAGSCCCRIVRWA